MGHVIEKTHNTFKVAFNKGKIKLSKASSSNRETSLGTVQTGKVIAVYNEENTKYTFKVENLTNANSVINLIVVDMRDTIIEYFIQYIFNDINALPTLSSGAVDMGAFTGSMIVYNDAGDEIGNFGFTNGNNTSRNGATNPCDETTTDYGNSETESGEGGGGSESGGDDGSSGNAGGSSGCDGCGENDSFDEASCGLEWNYEQCGCGGSANGHEPQAGTSCCNGSPLVVTNTCTGESWSSRNGSVTRELIDPCAGGVGVLIPLDDCDVSNETFNAGYTYYSPFNVDLSAIREDCNNTVGIDTSLVAANAKFMCIYNKLTQSPKFKDLFIDTFGESEVFDVKFEVVDDLPTSINGISPSGNCQVTGGSTNAVTGELLQLNITIKINKNKMGVSALSVAKTILHESIHAYLNLKHYDCNQGTPFEDIINDLNNKDLNELLNEYYETACPQQEQHEFMFEYMLPTMSAILSDVRDSLVPLNHQQAAEAQMFINESNPTVDIFGNYTNDIPWNWNLFNNYFSMRGLENSNAYINNIGNDAIKVLNMDGYANTGTNLFKKDCID